MSSSLLADDLMGEDVKSQVSDIASTSFGPSRGQRTPQKQVLHAACYLGPIYKSFIKYIIFINNQSRVCYTLLSVGQKSKPPVDVSVALRRGRRARRRSHCVTPASRPPVSSSSTPPPTTTTIDRRAASRTPSRSRSNTSAPRSRPAFSLRCVTVT